MNELEKVGRAQADETVHFEDTFQLEYVHFTFSDFGGEEKEYTWTAKRRDDWHYLTPYGRAVNTIQTFKTLAGAKRNFIKQYSHYFQEVAK